MAARERHRDVCRRVLGVTIGRNVPLNEDLDAFGLRTATGDAIDHRRSSYEMPRNRWHHLRTIACVGSFALAAAAGLVGRPATWLSPETWPSPASSRSTRRQSRLVQPGRTLRLRAGHRCRLCAHRVRGIPNPPPASPAVAGTTSPAHAGPGNPPPTTTTEATATPSRPDSATSATSETAPRAPPNAPVPSQRPCSHQSMTVAARPGQRSPWLRAAWTAAWRLSAPSLR